MAVEELGRNDVTVVEFGAVSSNEIDFITAVRTSNESVWTASGRAATYDDHITASRSPLALNPQQRADIEHEVVPMSVRERFEYAYTVLDCRRGDSHLGDRTFLIWRQHDTNISSCPGRQRLPNGSYSTSPAAIARLSSSRRRFDSSGSCALTLLELRPVLTRRAVAVEELVQKGLRLAALAAVVHAPPGGEHGEPRADLLAGQRHASSVSAGLSRRRSRSSA